MTAERSPRPRPPRLALALLRLMLGPGLADYVEGDLAEEFYERATRSPARARFWYWRQVLSIDLLRLRREAPWEDAARTVERRRGWSTATDGLSELGLAARTLSKHAGFSTVVVTVLGLGIALATVMLAIVNAVFLEPLPFREPERLVVVWQDGTRIGGGARWSWSPALFDAFAEETELHEDIAATFPFPAALLSQDGAESIPTARVTPRFFDVFGVSAALGRTLLPGDRRVVVLSHTLWRRRFAASPNVLGAQISIEDLNPLRDPEASAASELYTVIGVMPPEFKVPMHFGGAATPAEMWLPFHRREAMPNPLTSALHVVARLAPGVELEEARAEARTVHESIQRRYPDHLERDIAVVPLYDDLVGNVRSTLWLLAAAAAFVLLIVLANLGNLFVTRGLVRSGELALRSALGASRSQLARLVLAESAVLCAASAFVGGLVAHGLLPVVLRVMPEGIPRLENARIDAIPLAAAVGVATVASVFFALSSLWTGRRNTGSSLQASHRIVRSGRKLQNGSVLVQTAVTVLLLVASGLSIQSLRNLLAIDPGFDGEHRLTFQLRLPQTRYPTDAEKIRAMTEMHRQIESVPGVIASGSSDQIPPDRGGSGGEFTSPMMDEGIHIALRTVTHHYLDALGLEPIEGRSFRETDDARSDHVVIVSRSAAEVLYPNTSPLGRVVYPSPLPESSAWPKTIVGVVPDLPTFHVDGAPFLEIYQLHEQAPWGQHKFVVHTEGDALTQWASVNEAVRAVDPQLPLVEVARLDDLVSRSIARPVFLTSILGLLTAAALLLSAVGTFGVLSYVAAQRMREVAVRLAIGASPRRIVLHLVSVILAVSTAGIALGAIAALAGRELINSQLYEVGASDPTSFVAAIAIAFAASSFAALPVARKAAATDPATVLRLE